MTIRDNLIVNISDPNERNLYIYSESPTNLHIKKNILMRTDTTRPMVEFSNASAIAQTDLDHNLYHYPGGDILRVEGVNYQALSAFRIDYPSQEAAGVEGDPLLADPFDDFRLTAASVLAIDSGAAMPVTVDDDYDRLARPCDGGEGGAAEWDIGPHEYSSGVVADGFETGNTSAWSLP